MEVVKAEESFPTARPWETEMLTPRRVGLTCASSPSSILVRMDRSILLGFEPIFLLPLSLVLWIIFNNKRITQVGWQTPSQLLLLTKGKLKRAGRSWHCKAWLLLPLCCLFFLIRKFGSSFLSQVMIFLESLRSLGGKALPGCQTSAGWTAFAGLEGEWGNSQSGLFCFLFFWADLCPSGNQAAHSSICPLQVVPLAFF